MQTQRLIEHVYGVNCDKSANALEALIKRLRRKLPADLIRTRRSVGYMMADRQRAVNAARPPLSDSTSPTKH